MASLHSEIGQSAAVHSDKSEKLNKALGIDLAVEDVQQNPEFVKLLTSLSNFVGPEGVCSHVQQDLKQAEEELRHEKHSWLIQHILYNELKEFLIDYDIKSQDTALSSEDRQFYGILQESITLSEITDYLECSPDPSSKTTLFGLKKEELLESNPHKQHLPYIQQKLIPNMEDRLRRKCEEMLGFYSTDSSRDPGKFSSKQPSQLPALVEADKQKLDENKAQLQEERNNKDKQFWLYYRTLLDSLELLQELTSQYRLQNQAEHDTVYAEWLMAKCDCLCLKIKLMELQILCETYTKDTVKALEVVRNHLETGMTDTQKEYNHISRALQSYQSVGMGFDGLVEEYRKLKEEVENKQWALSELQKN